MLARSIPLAICLAWLAYESHFSVSFFQQTVSAGVTSISQGVEQALGANGQSYSQIASAND